MQTNKKILVDIGTFAIAGGIVNTDDYNLETFFYRNTQTPTNLLAHPDTNFIELLVEDIKDISLSENISDVIIKIPSNDQLLLFDTPNPTKTDLYKELDKASIDVFDRYNEVVLHKKILDKKTGNAVYPISIYDKTFKNLIDRLEIDKENSIKSLDGNGDYYRNIYFVTTFDTLKRAGRNIAGKSAVIDASFSKTSVLLLDEGDPIDYKEFEFSGRDLIQIIGSKSSNDLEAIKMVNSGAFTVAVEEYMNYQITLIKEFLIDNNIEKIMVYGGLSSEEIKLTKFLNIDEITPREFSSSINEEREVVAYKIRQLGLLDKTDDIINPVNYTEFIESQENYEEIGENYFGTNLTTKAKENRKSFIPNITKDDKEFLEKNKIKSDKIYLPLHNKEKGTKYLRRFIYGLIFSGIFLLGLYNLGVINLAPTTYFTGIASSEQKEFANIVEIGTKESIKTTSDYILREDPSADKIGHFRAIVTDKDLDRPNPFRRSTVGSTFTITYSFSDIFFEKYGELIVNNLYKNFGYVLNKDGQWTSTSGISDLMDLEIKAYKIRESSGNTLVQIKATSTSELRERPTSTETVKDQE